MSMRIFQFTSTSHVRLSRARPKGKEKRRCIDGCVCESVRKQVDNNTARVLALNYGEDGSEQGPRDVLFWVARVLIIGSP